MALSFTAIDIETAAPQWNTICSVALVRVRNGIITDVRHGLVNPECDFSPMNTAIHGIDAAMVAEAPNFSAVAPAILEFIGDDVLVAHNASFDVNVLKRTFDRYGVPYPQIPVFCTLAASRALYQDFTSHKLDALCSHFNICLDHHHCAQDDARACAALMNHIADDLCLYSFDAISDALNLRVGFLNQREVVTPQSTEKPRSHRSTNDRSKIVLSISLDGYNLNNSEIYELREEMKCQAEVLLRQKEEEKRRREEALRVQREEAAKRRQEEAARIRAEQAALREEKRQEKQRQRIEAANEKLDSQASSSRPIMQLSDDGSHVRMFSSITAAARSTGINAKSIRCVLDGTQHHAGGFLWQLCEPYHAVSPAVVQFVKRFHASQSALPESLFELRPTAIGASLLFLGKPVARFVAESVILDSSYLDNPSDFAAEWKTSKLQNTITSYRIELDAIHAEDALFALFSDICDQFIPPAIQMACCNDFIRCSDARQCLKRDDPDYIACAYRKNLEAGRIFYGINKNC